MTGEKKEALSPWLDNYKATTERLNRQFPGVPESIVGGLVRYVTAHILPGGFLSAVLRNDMADAMGRADDRNRRSIDQICEIVREYVPPIARGSRAKLDDWIDPAMYPPAQTEDK